MDNFKQSDLITQVAFQKDKKRFIPKNQQIEINRQLGNRIIQFAKKMNQIAERPHSMLQFDQIMNDIHGKRVKDLYQHRKNGGHIIALLCHAIPPELIYALENHIPVNICMGAGEVEKYGDQYTQGLCPIARSIAGFFISGMCVFLNLSDTLFGNNRCDILKKTANMIDSISNEIELFLIKSDSKQGGIDFNSFQQWIDKEPKKRKLDRQNLIKYATLFSEIRETYTQIMASRKENNPPIDGKNSLWIQQLYLVAEPHQLLLALKNLKNELDQNIVNNIGYNPDHSKKRVLLITPRMMIPFTEIYSIIEECNAIIVAEEICMGISNTQYDLNHLLETNELKESKIEDLINNITGGLSQSECSCHDDYNPIKLQEKITQYHIDAIIHFSFTNCSCMINKEHKITDECKKCSIPSLTIESDYLNVYQGAEKLREQMNNFLSKV